MKAESGSERWSEFETTSLIATENALQLVVEIKTINVDSRFPDIKHQQFLIDEGKLIEWLRANATPIKRS